MKQETRVRKKQTRAATVLAAACAVPLVLSSCALQTDWSGEKKLASEECAIAAQLFPQAALPADAASERSTHDGSLPETAEGDEGAGGSSATNAAAIAAQLREYVPEDMHDVLDMYATSVPEIAVGESEERQAEVFGLMASQSWAEEVLQGWAQLSCGDEVAWTPVDLPTLSQMHTFESEVEGVRVVSVAGATEPDHAIALCEEARVHEAEAQIRVTDSGGFPLAFAAAAEPCDYDPILFTGLDTD